MIGNYQRLIDGYLAELGYEVLLPAVQQVSGTHRRTSEEPRLLSLDPPECASGW